MLTGDGKRLLFVAVFVFAFALAGCATAPVITELSPTDAKAEIPQLEETIAKNENNVDANYRLGLALHAVGRSDEAIPHLQKACNLDPSRIDAAFVLGKIHDERGDLAAAEAVLLQTEPDGRGAQQLVQATLEEISRKRDGENMRKILAGENQIETSSIPENSLAVYEFRAGPSAWELDKMGKALSAVLLTDLSRLSELRLVERRKLATLQQEMSQFGLGGARIDRSGGPVTRRSMPDLAPVNQLKGVQERLTYLTDGNGNPYYAGPLDGARSEASLSSIRAFQRDRGLGVDGIPGPNTQRNLDLAMQDWLASQSVSGIPKTNGGAPADPGDARVGMLLGARKLISGRYETPNDGDLKVDAQILDTVDGTIIANFTSEQPLDQFHVVPGELVVHTADALAIELTDKERREILSLPPATKSLAAFLAFGKGIDLEDRGMIADANEAFAEAVRLDGGFQLARDRVAITQIGSASFQTALNRMQRAGATAGSSYGSAGGDAAARAVGAIGLEVEEATLGEDDSTKRAPQTSGPPVGTVRATGNWPAPGTRGGSKQ